MSQNATQKALDWDKVHELVIDQANEVVDGFAKEDVDWFLRDTNVSILEQAPHPQTGSPEKRSISEHNPPSLVTPSSPRLQVLNTNENSMSKTRPSIAPVQEEEAQSVLAFLISSASCKEKNRRGSLSSVVSAGSTLSANGSVNGSTFFSKLKHRLLRTESNSGASSPTITFNQEFGFEKPSRDSNSVTPSLNGLTSIDSSDSKSPISTPCEQNKLSNALLDDFEDPRLREYVIFFRQQENKLCYSRSLSYVPPKLELHRINSLTLKVSKPPEPGKISSLFRRRSVASVPVLLSPVKSEEQETSISEESSYFKPEAKSVPDKRLPDSKKMKSLKHVAFHSLTFLIDPPQQIPSRNPRQGNVEVLPQGGVRINPLTEEDKVLIEKSLRGKGGGLVVGGTGACSFANPGANESETVTAQDPLESSNLEKTTEDEPQIDLHAKSLGIDKPLANRSGYKAPIKKMALDLMYSRCCHLREILPIPGIAKQIPKGSMAPLPFLQFRNPTPTMIEVETFADFIRIAPIICISFDGVNLSYGQWKILLSAMCAKTQLEKLSLRNTPLDPEGWALFCWFLSRNKSINRLDVTQCPPLSVLKKKKKSKPEEEAIVRMVCNKENRSDMDWFMFTACLIARGGIEELILTGCCISDSKVFETLIRKAISIRTAKLGLAYNQLSPQQFFVVLDSYFFSSKTKGLDLGYNDLLSSAFLRILTDLYKRDDLRQMLSESQLGFLSLNATNLRFNNLFKEFYEECLATLPNLKYLDFSNNPKLFGNFSITAPINGLGDTPSVLNLDMPHEEKSKYGTPESINSYFCSILPRFPSLVRLHLENNGLSSKSLTNLFEIVPFCKDLAYLSIIGNHLDIYSAASLIQGLKNSTSLMTIDGDFLSLPESFKERIGSYSMRNMENYYLKVMLKKPLLDSSTDYHHSETLTDQLNKLLSQRKDHKIDLQLPDVKLFIDRTLTYRQKLKESIQDLFALQYSGDLNIEGKEALIRLLFVDSSLERGLKLIDKSLVNQEESITSTEILNMTLAEDENNEMRNSNAKVDSEGSELNDSLSRVDSIMLPISRNQSSATLSSLNKEEGSAMKFARITDKEAVLDKFDNYSGEEIRQKIRNFNLSDLDNLIDTINEARKRGVCFKQIFNDSKFIDNFKDDLKQRIENLKQFAANHSGLQEHLPRFQSQEIDLSRSSESTNIDDSVRSKDISEAYDRILSKFNK